MGFYGPKKTHIKRIFGKRKKEDGTTEEVREIYADVERTDSLPTMEWPGAQDTTINLQWRDAPGEDGNPGRRMTNVKLTDPEDDSDNPEFFIEIPTIDRMTMVRHPGAQEIVTTFQPSAADPMAEERETARTVAVRRIPFCETNVDDVLDETGYLADGEDYERKLDTIDESQHLDVEIVESYPSKVYNGPSPQDVKVSLDNSALKEAYAKPPNDAAKRPPLRLDPFQNIRNVCWGSGATEFEPGATITQFCTLPESPKLSISMWVRVPENLPGMLPILQFSADETLPLPYVPSSVMYAGAGTILCAFRSAMTYDSNDLVSCYKYVTGGAAYLGHTISNGDNSCALQFQISVPTSDPNVVNGDKAFVDGRWNHIAISLDASSPTMHGNPDPLNVVSGNGSRGLYDASFVLNRISHTEAVAYENFVSLVANQFGNNQPSTQYLFTDCPNFSLNFNGNFGLPVQPVNASSAPGEGWPFSLNNFEPIDFAAVQIWHDQFIDFRDPDVLAKFVAPAGADPSADSVDGIRLVDPSVAQKAFGKPTFFFDGGPSRFVKNQGSGGDFTKIGDLKSFRPAPPRASSGTTS